MNQASAAIRQADRYGWRLHRRGKKHVLYVCPCGRCRPLPVGGSPGDVRSLKNLEAQLRRCPAVREGMIG